MTSCLLTTQLLTDNYAAMYNIPKSSNTLLRDMLVKMTASCACSVIINSIIVPFETIKTRVQADAVLPRPQRRFRGKAVTLRWERSPSKHQINCGIQLQALWTVFLSPSRKESRRCGLAHRPRYCAVRFGGLLQLRHMTCRSCCS